MSTKELMSSARRTFLNMKRILGELQPKAKEIGSVHRLRVEAFFCERWNMSPSMFRRSTSPTFPPERWPSKPKNARFFEDLRKYGAARFTNEGVAIKSSIGNGPDFETFSEEIYSYKTMRSASARAEL